MYCGGGLLSFSRVQGLPAGHSMPSGLGGLPPVLTRARTPRPRDKYPSRRRGSRLCRSRRHADSGPRSCRHRRRRKPHHPGWAWPDRVLRRRARTPLAYSGNQARGTRPLGVGETRRRSRPRSDSCALRTRQTLSSGTRARGGQVCRPRASRAWSPGITASRERGRGSAETRCAAAPAAPVPSCSVAAMAGGCPMARRSLGGCRSVERNRCRACGADSMRSAPDCEVITRVSDKRPESIRRPVTAL